MSRTQQTVGILGWIFLLGCCLPASASPCDEHVLPEDIRSILATSYAGWKVIASDLLDQHSLEIWNRNNFGDCPGIVKGNFTGLTNDYAVNLVRNSQETLYEQLLLFTPDVHGFKKIILLAPMQVASISVITKMPPGKYADAEGVRQVITKYDSVALTDPEKGVVLYYWSGKRFHSVITSE
jgi:hypothetical protein